MMIKCKDCIFAKIAPETKEGGWCGVKCDNRESNCHGALLNVDPNGNKHNYVSWGGCPHGVERNDLP